MQKEYVETFKENLAMDQSEITVPMTDYNFAHPGQFFFIPESTYRVLRIKDNCLNTSA
jgi:hypothetical protein